MPQVDFTTFNTQLFSLFVTIVSLYSLLRFKYSTEIGLSTLVVNNILFSNKYYDRIVFYSDHRESMYMFLVKFLDIENLPSYSSRAFYLLNFFYPYFFFTENSYSIDTNIFFEQNDEN